MKTLPSLLRLSVSFAFVGLASVAVAASFSAEMVDTKGGETRTTAFQFLDGSYRYETAQRERALVVVVDAKAGVTRIAEPAKREYMEMKADDLRAVLLNPFAACTFPFEGAVLRSEGAETVGGLRCTRKVLAVRGGDFFTAAIADEYAFPIRIEDRLQQRTVELRNLKPQPLDAALFAVPAGYRLMQEPVEPAPEWAAKIPGAPVVVPPFQRTLAVGEIVRVRPQAGRHLRVQGTNAGRDDCTFATVAFKAGRPLQNPSDTTASFGPGGEVTMTAVESPTEADELVIRVARGRVAIRADFVAAGAGNAQAGRPGAAPAVAPDANRLMLILDSSGSMAETIQGRAKIEMAKEAFANLVDGLPAELEVGLIAYGHRRSNDCRDIEVLLPVGKVDKPALREKVASVKPRGRTPLGAAVKQAAESLEYLSRRATVVLVSDGLETCDADPCAIAAELARTGRDFKLHVIGFALSERDQARLRCLADNTGGLFLAATDSATLRDALSQSVATVQEPPKPVVEEPGPATISGPSSVATGATFDVQWTGSDDQNDTIALATKGAVERTLAYAYTSRGSPAHLVAAADPGDYELRYVHGHTGKVLARADLRVTPVEAQVVAPPAVDAAAEFAVSWKGPAYDSDCITIARRDQSDGAYLSYAYVREANPVKLRAPGEEGDYEVRYVLGRGGKKLAFAPLTVRPVVAKLVCPDTAETGAGLEVTWQGPGNNDDMITVSRPEQESGAYLNFAWVRGGNPARVWAPAEPGDYEVRYVLGHGLQLLAKSVLHVGAATASVVAPARAPAAGWLDVTWTGPSADGDYVCVSRPEQAPGTYLNYVRVKSGNPLRIRAPGTPGEYEVRYVLERGRKILAKSVVTIDEVAATVEPPATVKAGQEFEVRWQGPGNNDDMLTLSRPDQPSGAYLNYVRVRPGAAAKLRAPKEAGRYEVRYVLGVGNRALAKAAITVVVP